MLYCSLQWDGVENKTSVLVYAGGAVVLLWLSSTIVGAVNAVPVVRVTSSTNKMRKISCGFSGRLYHSPLNIVTVDG